VNQLSAASARFLEVSSRRVRGYREDVSDRFLWGVKQTSFLREARQNITKREAATAHIERE
jgi:hypothetical protein